MAFEDLYQEVEGFIDNDGKFTITGIALVPETNDEYCRLNKEEDIMKK